MIANYVECIFCFALWTSLSASRTWVAHCLCNYCRTCSPRSAKEKNENIKLIKTLVDALQKKRDRANNDAPTD